MPLFPIYHTYVILKLGCVMACALKDLKTPPFQRNRITTRRACPAGKPLRVPHTVRHGESLVGLPAGQTLRHVYSLPFAVGDFGSAPDHPIGPREDLPPSPEQASIFLSKYISSWLETSANMSDTQTLSAIYTQDLENGPSFNMILVEEGAFMMGGTDDEAFDREKPVHRVRVSSFYLGEYLVTQELWEAIRKTNPSDFKGPKHPIENVSWNDTQQFLQQLNQQTGLHYRLPTEAEWEFAARGGIRSEEYLYAGSDKLKEVGWYEANSDNQTYPVAQKMENELGLFDMSGNVFEWCEDWYGRNYYEECRQKGLVGNPAGPVTGAGRVIRGGDWGGSAQGCRVSYRSFNSPGVRNISLGFRLALVPQSVGREP